MATSSLVVDVTELLRHPGVRKPVHTRAEAPAGLRVVDTIVPEGAEVEADVTLESLPDGIVVSGVVTAPWEAQCRRCLKPVEGHVAARVRELYRQEPVDGDDAYVVEGDRLDLTPLTREAVVLDLPLAPLCRPDCRGLCPVCGADRNETDCGHGGAARDERWAALDALLDELRPLDPPEH
jgi:uncharacterized protein